MFLANYIVYNLEPQKYHYFSQIRIYNFIQIQPSQNS